MKTYNDLLNKYRKDFGEDINTLRAFLFELCNEKEIDLYLEKDREANPEVEAKFEDGVKRLLNDEPLNYVLGYSYFYGYKLKVNEGCLIPRFETEELVGRVLTCYDEYFKGKKINVCDIGTGSGAIAIALKKEEPNMNVTASDISLDALKLAEENAKSNNADVTFLCGSMCDPLIEKGIKVDILVSNPPYIKQDEVLENSVKDFEPHVALFGGDDGLKFYRMIFERAKELVNPNGFMFFEMGYDQKENLTNLAKKMFENAEVEVFKDINGKDRMLMVRFV